ncbi:Rieske (2Fe-2S) protein [Streptomyces sp. SL13]|uniref:Cytochrome bc1 complex Rieske iron-sulfur subunit n=1 Tax=Streptantibioticus silvisoli TaxID=2705255 RepID=A0AA90H799_9ACTN|nr:Rieske (2Fe-2S) protein [Streptantibioticus silvisoli]MDI5969277.1 Rieske (2Fe-2S) protein [Streptantibioticus silvisoli]
MDITSATPTGATTRRTVVAMAGASGLAVALAACGGSGSKSATSSAAPSAAGGPAAGGSGGSSSAPAGGSGTALAKTSEIPEGGGKIFADQKVVVTQPKAGEFKCFSAVCTHQGCTVAQVKDGTIDCPCHGSKFHIADGSVAGGPAPRPLPAEKFSVSGGEITLG